MEANELKYLIWWNCILALMTMVTPAICVLGSLLNMVRRAKLVEHSSVGEMMAGFQSRSREKYKMD